jgi:release factor glutamine methyltransferase
MTPIRLLRRGWAEKLRGAGVETPDLDVRLLLSHASGLSHSDFVVRSNDTLPSEIVDAMDKFVQRRLAGEPVDHILGYKDFYGRRFNISKDVLSPRQETEGLVGRSLALISDSFRVLDLGTGSGAVIISILAEIEGASGTATDISAPALKAAKENAKRHGVLDRVDFVQSNWLENVTGTFDLIVSNPPYITDEAMKALAPDVIQYDPRQALAGGADGLTAYRDILNSAQDFLAIGGYLVFEIGYDQGASVSRLMRQAGFSNIKVTQDLASHDRIVEGQFVH